MNMSTVPEQTRVGGARPVALILLATVAFSAQDAVVKYIAEEVTLWQLQSVRSLATVLMLVAVMAGLGRLAWVRPLRLGWPLLRSLFMAAAYLLFYASLPHLALSQAAAAFFVGPLFITLLAAIFLGEPIGPRRIAAVVLGFSGVLLIVRPWGEAVEAAALLPVAAAFCYAMGIVVTRWRCHGERGIALTLVHNLVYSAIGLAGLAFLAVLPIDPQTRAAEPFLLDAWRPLTLVPVLLMLSTAASHVLGMLCSIRAYQSEEASRLAPFEYFYLLIVPLLDIAIWGVVPDAMTLGGMGLIGLAGVFVAMREGRRARPTVLPSGRPPWTGAAAAGKKTP